EGTTNIIIKCGNKSIEFTVHVDYSVNVEKKKLNAIIQEQLYVKRMMISRDITNADKLELDSLINTSKKMLNSSTISSSEIVDHIELVKGKLFLFSNNNSIFYKYLSNKTDSNTENNKLTNMLFDNTKKIVVTFGLTDNKTATFVSGTNFSMR